MTASLCGRDGEVGEERQTLRRKWICKVGVYISQKRQPQDGKFEFDVTVVRTVRFNRNGNTSAKMSLPWKLPMVRKIRFTIVIDFNAVFSFAVIDRNTVGK
jgi:hypothetical protein